MSYREPVNSQRLTVGAQSGVEVDTILTHPVVIPGGSLRGEVHFRGGRTDYNIATLSLEFLATLGPESGNPHYPLTIPFGHVDLASELTLTAGAREVLPFDVPVPWLTPINTVGTARLPGVSLGIHTGMRMGGSFNHSDSDPLEAAPMPVAEQVLKALERARFTFVATDLTDIRITPAATSFVQQIKCLPGPEFAARVHEVTVAFVSNSNTVNVQLSTDVGSSQQFTVSHADVSSLRADELLTAGLRALRGEQ